MRGLRLTFDALGDAGDAAEPAVPRGADRRQLGSGPGELGVVDPEPPLPTRGGAVHQAHAVEHGEGWDHYLARLVSYASTVEAAS